MKSIRAEVVFLVITVVVGLFANITPVASYGNSRSSYPPPYPPPSSIFYVKSTANGLNNGSSWTDAYTDLQSALAAASSGDEIWVAAGIYKPTSSVDRTISFTLKSGVALYGGFTGTETLRTQRDPLLDITILSGDIGTANNNSDNSYHVVVGSGANNTTILDGFTITAGNADPGGTYSTSFDGGGMFSDSGSPSLSNIIFDTNTAVFYGGGMYNSNGSPALSHVTFVNNVSDNGGGMYNDNGSQPTLMDVTFSSNVVNGGSGGGMMNTKGSSPTITNTTFDANVAGFGGGLYNNASSPSLINVTFSGNTGNEYGGGIFNFSNSNPTLTNVTLSGNVSHNANLGNVNGGIYNWDSSPTILNSILWGNSGDQITDNNSGTSTVSYSVVQGGHIGIGNLSANPLLDPLANNGGFTQTMALGAGSPAIDAGDDGSCPSADQRGVTRPTGSHCDIGAYEYNKSTQPGPNLVVNTNADTNDGVCDLLGQGIGNQDCTLREAINGISSGGTITFDNSLAGDTIILTSTLVIDKALTIDGSNLSQHISISGDTNSDGKGDIGIFQIVNSNSVVNLDGLDIIRGFNHNGGGIENESELTIKNSNFISNTAVLYGGAIYNAGKLTIQASSFWSNRAFPIITNDPDGYGGAIYNGNLLNVTNSTFYFNQVYIRGGGVFNDEFGVATLINNTMDENSASSGQDVYNDLGILHIINNIFGSCVNNGGSIASDIDNLIVNNVNCGTPAITSDPKLGLLANNGGFTQTMALGIGSPAIDAGNDANCPATDQRGMTRPQGSHCDIGAYEVMQANFQAADFNGDGKTDVAVFRPSNTTWYVQGQGSVTYGQAGDIPVPADYNGDGKADIAVFRPSNSTWYIRGQGSFAYGQAGDIPVVADYNGDGKADIAVFRPSNSTWYLYRIGPRVYGAVGDIPVVADYNGDGKADIAVFRPSNNTWYIYGVGPRVYGTVGDLPVIGDYNGDHKADIAVFRPSNSTWYLYGVGPQVYGVTGDIPV